MHSRRRIVRCFYRPMVKIDRHRNIEIKTETEKEIGTGRERETGRTLF